MRLLLAALVAGQLTASSPQPAPLLTLPAPITESSGLASSSVSDAWFFTHEDSGAPAQLEAVGMDGRLLATYRLPGVQARDWEDMARGPDEQGRSCLFLADIGDNDATRDRGVLVHRIPEPAVDPGATRRTVTTPPPVSYRLLYPDGPRDAETLLVQPRTGRMFVVSKGLSGAPAVYAAPEHPSATSPNRLVRVAGFTPERTGTPGGPGIGSVANALVTAGDVSPDGGRVALRTYTDLYEWRVPDGDLAAAFATTPVVVPLPATVQGEGLAYTRDGTALLTSSEGVGAPVHRVPSPLLAGAASATAGPSPAVPTVVAPPAASASPSRHLGRALIAAAVVVLGAVALSVLRRRRRSHR